MEKVICVPNAKVPIVKVWDPELSLACDMNVNNPLALENTRMIRTYVQIDPRVRQLAMIVKHWTKKRILNDAGKRISPHPVATCLTCLSFRLHTEFVHLDMHDHILSTNSKSSDSSSTAPAAA